MTDFVALEHGGFRWWLHPSLAVDGSFDWLAGEQGPPLQTWLAKGHATVLKEAPHRSLYRVQMPHVDLHVKYYPLADLWGTLRQLVRASKARREFSRIQEVTQRGIATLEPLALAEACDRSGASYLLTRTLPQTRTLGAMLETELPEMDRARANRIRQNLAQKLGLFLAAMHNAGLCHDDLHPGNLLVSLDAQDVPSLAVIDLLACQVREPLDWATSRENLSLFNRWFMLRSSQSDRLRFWRAYESARAAVLPVDVNGLRERQLEKQSLRSNERLWATFSRRCLDTRGSFRRIATASVRGHTTRLMPAELLDTLTRNPDAVLDLPGAETLKHSRSSHVVRVPDPRDPARSLIWKRFAVTTWTDPLVALVRTTPAVRSWVLGHMLRARGIPTPLPLLVLHRQWLRLPQEGYLLTEALPDSRHLRDHADHLLTCPEPERQERLHAVLMQVADVIARMHRTHLAHRDLKASNILVSSQAWRMPLTSRPNTLACASAIPGNEHVWLIDLVGVRSCRRLSRRRKFRDLARLYLSFREHPLISATTRLRFLKAYLGLHGLDETTWKAYWHGITQAAQAKVARNERVGRPLH